MYTSEVANRALNTTCSCQHPFCASLVKVPKQPWLNSFFLHFPPYLHTSHSYQHMKTRVCFRLQVLQPSTPPAYQQGFPTWKVHQSLWEHTATISINHPLPDQQQLLLWWLLLYDPSTFLHTDILSRLQCLEYMHLHKVRQEWLPTAYKELLNS